MSMQGPETSETPVVGATEVSDLIRTAQELNEMSIAPTQAAQQIVAEQPAHASVVYQAIAFLSHGWEERLGDGPDLTESILIGVFATMEEADLACRRALKAVHDYIGYTIRGIRQLVSAVTEQIVGVAA